MAGFNNGLSEFRDLLNVLEPAGKRLRRRILFKRRTVFDTRDAAIVAGLRGKSVNPVQGSNPFMKNRMAG